MLFYTWWSRSHESKEFSQGHPRAIMANWTLWHKITTFCLLLENFSKVLSLYKQWGGHFKFLSFDGREVKALQGWSGILWEKLQGFVMGDTAERKCVEWDENGTAELNWIEGLCNGDWEGILRAGRETERDRIRQERKISKVRVFNPSMCITEVKD